MPTRANIVIGLPLDAAAFVQSAYHAGNVAKVRAARRANQLAGAAFAVAMAVIFYGAVLDAASLFLGR